MTKFRWIFLLALIAATVWIVKSNNGSANLRYFKNNGTIFGTIYSASYNYDRDIQAEIEKELKKVDFSLSPFNKESVISKINRNEDVTPDSMFTNVFNLAQSISTVTDGNFDITVAPLVNAWGFGFKKKDSITAQKIDSLRTIVGYQKVKLEGGKIKKDDNRIMLDCSAIAKGYGTDCVARLFNRLGITDYMIEIGGEIVVKGHNPHGKSWKIGVSKPVDDSLAIETEQQTILNVTDIAMATSGNYRNFYYKDGKKYAHTIDPKTGYPVQHSILSSTVLAKDCATADAFATSFMVMGLEKAKALLAKHPEIQAYFIYSGENGENLTFQTEGMKKWMTK
ncbi:MAG: FAD:protein FMN transferase [Bacteroidaceae bacterium]|nr:FAD:protein FMN transferase [Bacteroidaceae bacterium]